MKVARTCVVCRKLDEKDVLLRIVHQEGFVFDFAQVLKGRGFYVHCSESCLAEKKIVTCFGKLKSRFVGGRKSVGEVFRGNKQNPSKVDVTSRSQKLFQISLDLMIEEGRKCLGFLEENGNNKKIILAKKLFERTKEIILLSSKSKQLGQVLKKPPLRL